MQSFFKLFKPSFLDKIDYRTEVFFLLIWGTLFLLGAQFNSNELIPKPNKVFHAFISIVSDPTFLDNQVATMTLILTGMGLSIAIALSVSYLSLIPAFSGIAQFVSKLRFLTFTGLIFVFTILLKNGHQIKISLLLFGIIPYFVTSFLSYVKDIPKKEYELGYTLKFNTWKTLFEVVIRGRLHTVLEVIKQNFAIAWMMITAVEGYCMSEGGIGTLMIKSSKYMKIDEVFAVLLVVFVLGMFFDYFFDLLKVFFFPYTDPNRHRLLWVNRLLSTVQNRVPKEPVPIVTEPAISHTAEPQKAETKATGLYNSFKNIFVK